jgi:hypothetical protein
LYDLTSSASICAVVQITALQQALSTLSPRLSHYAIHQNTLFNAAHMAAA